MTVSRTLCPLDCPDGCSLAVTVEDGVITKVDAAPPGDGVNPLTQGFICAKVRKSADRVHGPGRLRTPLIRTGPKGAGPGSFREATWDEALDLTAERITAAIDEHGPGSVIPYLYNSSSGALGAGRLGPLLWRALGASSVAKTICAATAGEAWELVFGDRPGADLHDVVYADLIVLWGANPSASNTHLPPLVQQARRAGARLVVIDPRRTPLAGQADVHLAVRPGTDVVLALALAGELDRRGALDRAAIDERSVGAGEHLAECARWELDAAAATCGLDADDVRAVVDLLATARAPFLRPGYGLERTATGGAAHRAVLALGVVVGAAVHLSTNHDAGFDQDALTAAVLGERGSPDDLRRGPAGPVRNMNHLGRWLAGTHGEDRASVLFVQGSNPAATAPDQLGVLLGLARDDLFTVVHDQVLTDTARYADVVLPATTHFEIAEVAAPYGAFWREAAEPVIPRVGESRTNDEVTAALAVCLGLPAERFDPDPARVLGLLTPDGSVATGPADRAAMVAEAAAAVPRARLVTDRSDIDRVPTYRAPAADDDAPPLTLLTPATARTINSMFGERDDRPLEVVLHPADAAARGVVDGGPVTVANARASLTAVAKVDDTVRPGVVSMAKGRWLSATPEGLSANALVPDALADLAGGATFNDARVEITPVG